MSNIVTWVKQHKALAAGAGGVGALLYLSHKGHQSNSASGDPASGGSDTTVPQGQIVPLVQGADQVDGGTTGDIYSGQYVGGDVNSPLSGPLTSAGSSGDVNVSGGGDITDSGSNDPSPLDPAQAANDAAGNNPPGHPGYTHPKVKRDRQGHTKAQRAAIRRKSPAAERAYQKRLAAKHSSRKSPTRAAKPKAKSHPVVHSTPVHHAAPAPVHHAAPKPKKKKK